MKKSVALIKKIAYASLSIILFFAFWETASRGGLVTSVIIPPPTWIIKALFEAAGSGELFTHFKVSIGRAAIGFILSIIVGIPAGFLLDTFFKTFERILLPFLRMLEKLNPFALFPIFMIIFGIGDLEKIFVIFWVAQWPLIFNTISGTKSIDPYMIKSARSMGASRRVLFFKVILPAALPSIFTGIKISAQISFFMLVASEMVGSTQGLGWYYLSSSNSFQIPLTYGIILFISVLGVIINALFTKIEKHFLVWKESTFQIN